MQSGEGIIIKNDSGLLNILFEENLTPDCVQKLGIGDISSCRWEFHKSPYKEIMVSTLYSNIKDNRKVFIALIDCDNKSVEFWSGYITDFEHENELLLFETIDR